MKIRAEIRDRERREREDAVRRRYYVIVRNCYREKVWWGTAEALRHER